MSEPSGEPDRLDAMPAWDAFFSEIEARSRAVAADALSLGVVQDGVVCTYNVGFSDRVSAAYAQIPVDAGLPGPEVLRTRRPLYLRSNTEARARFPETRAIHVGTRYEAAVCLLVSSPERGHDLGYLALHFNDVWDFNDSDRLRLDAVAENVSNSLFWLLARSDAPSPRQTPEPVPAKALALQTAMQRRAQIERARGVVMRRYNLDASQALRLMTQRSAASGIAMHVVAQTILSTIEIDRG